MVSDTGIGIAPEWKDRIFDAFVQVDGSNVRRYGGTRPGAVHLLTPGGVDGWTYVGRERSGEGSAFHFTVTFGNPFIATAMPETHIVEPEVMHGLDVLVVDDNATSRRILDETLTGWQMKPVLADSAAKALETMRERSGAVGKFAVILLDGQMPGIWTGSHWPARFSKMRCRPVLDP